MASHDLPLGRAVDYPRGYDPGLLFPIARAHGRAELGVGGALPFEGTDRWPAYELGWLDARGKPAVATATVTVLAHSPQLVESKSRSEEHTSELQSLMRNSYAVFCLKKKKPLTKTKTFLADRCRHRNTQRINIT